ncbi:endo-1,4-beta-xylanase [Clavibacter nebraskensis]|uniref:Beta-xylanase n=2 Tax=Clavibacter nebraskensis TaxID=31963 RepID=A0AAI8ZGY2_9MICO|nr:endo-1,4-beta-xylanase [Clavibacter nebraskensis]KXU21506.1 1,4-beta-xylanase [Clavibacter nebraskensis]OAH19075.1 1,4-beta-xylanase [Clavibacter nebraskensis]QGV66049.1 endo-1,4-beta-xylanase [Clavibacter nebraskensis]QGV68847.1 endo-1,4-beta-xylanase [Clavibacter nebraskensis]QGV71637.1 endo-1,4-beta-xylanase [Clavibacter nebraskensis]
MPATPSDPPTTGRRPTAIPDVRRADAVITVRGADGQPLAHADVVVEQASQDIAFGNIGFDLIPLANGVTDPEAAGVAAFGGARLEGLERLAEQWLDVFDTATLPFYWGRFEPVRGRPDTARLLTTARWLRERGVAVKGHPLVWHTVTASWLLDLPLDEVERVQRERIRRDVGDFAGLVDTWDAINEAVIMPVFDREDNGITRLAAARGRLAMVRLAFEEARGANPAATLILNDFDLSPAYEELIEEVLGAGIPVDAIGLQTHMHQGYRGEEEVLGIVDRFARFGLPIHMTETTLLSGDPMPPEITDLNDFRVTSWPSTPAGEERQAEEVERHYRSLVGHPAVAAITYWGLTDDGMWLGAPGGLVRADGTTKPSYDALRRLIREEWRLAPTTLRTDAEGRVRVTAFAGGVRVAHAGCEAVVAVAAGASEVEAALG